MNTRRSFLAFLPTWVLFEELGTRRKEPAPARCLDSKRLDALELKLAQRKLKVTADGLVVVRSKDDVSNEKDSLRQMADLILKGRL